MRVLKVVQPGYILGHQKRIPDFGLSYIIQLPVPIATKQTFYTN